MKVLVLCDSPPSPGGLATQGDLLFRGLSVYDIAEYLRKLMNDSELRQKLDRAGRIRVQTNYDYRVVAKQLVELMSTHLGI